jgi:predicted transcriptional regulator of viral defense system
MGRGAPPRAREAIIGRLRSEGRDSLSLAEDADWLRKITANPARLLSDMAKKGYAHRIQAGRYLIETGGEGPQEQPLVEALEPLARNLLDRLGVPYYLSWHTALFYYGLIEQQSATIYCGIPAEKAPARFGSFGVRFVKVSRDSFFGVEPVLDFPEPVIMASPEKALLDSLRRPDLAASYPVIIAAFEQACERGLISSDRLVAYTTQAGSGALARRVGFLMDRCGMADSERLLEHIGARRRFEAFRPGDDRRQGEPDSKWRLRVPPRLLLTAEQLK